MTPTLGPLADAIDLCRIPVPYFLALLHSCAHFRICFYFHLVSEHTSFELVAGTKSIEGPWSHLHLQRPHDPA